MAAAPEAPSDGAPKGGLSTALEVVKAVALAFFDIFKAPPDEPTGKDAPGLLALGAGGVVGALRGCQVQAVRDGATKDASELVAAPAPWDVVFGGNGTTMLFFITHFGDFNSWEVLQRLRTARREGRLGGASVAVVGIGTIEAGRKLAEFLDLPEGLDLYADASGACHRALGFSQGALPQYADQLNPYFRVFLMLLGVGSPGTIQTVLSGYFGNRDFTAEQTSWVDEALKQGAAQGRFPTRVPRRLPWEAAMPGEDQWVDVADAGSSIWDGRGFGETGLRPFELATVRLQNMVSGIIEHWDELKPPDDELLVQQGGAVVLRNGGEAVYYYRDKGILTYVPLEDALVGMRSA